MAPHVVTKKAPELLALMRVIRKRKGMWPTPMVSAEEAAEAGIV